MLATRCAPTGTGMHIYSQSRLPTVLPKHQTGSTTALCNSRNSERKWLLHIAQRNLHSTTITEIISERKHICSDSLCSFEHDRGFLRQNLHPWSVLQCRTNDTPWDQTSQILAEPHRLGSKLFFFNSYLR